MGSRDDRLGDIAGAFKYRYVTIEQSVESFVRTAITSGVYRPGEHITQETIARALGVSRIPVRAALRKLEAEGLVRVVPRRGATVVALTASEVAEVFELRTVVECHLLERCVPRLSDKGLRQLQELAASSEPAPAEEFGTLQLQFYETLYSFAERPQSTEMVLGLRAKMDRYRPAQRFLDAEDRHSTLLDHLAARDVPEAQAWLRHHLDKKCRAVQALVDPSAAGDAGGAGARSSRQLASPALTVDTTASPQPTG